MRTPCLGTNECIRETQKMANRAKARFPVLLVCPLKARTVFSAKITQPPAARMECQ